MSAPGENLRINGDRLWDSLMEMARIGPGIAGGNNRQTLTDSDKEGRELFQRWCDAAGLTMGVDKMGTMFMTRAGTDPDAILESVRMVTRAPAQWQPPPEYLAPQVAETVCRLVTGFLVPDAAEVEWRARVRV